MQTERVKQFFAIMEKLPSLNEVIAANRANRYKGADLKKNTELMIGMYILKAKAAGNLVPTKKPCEVIFEWHEKTQKRDCDNIASAKKFILDALQKYKIIENDNQKYITGFRDIFIKDDHTFVMVYLIEKGDA